MIVRFKVITSIKYKIEEIKQQRRSRFKMMSGVKVWNLHICMIYGKLFAWGQFCTYGRPKSTL